MLDRHDTGVRKELLRVVVDELPIDEGIDALRDDLVALVLHLLPLGELDLCHFAHAVGAHASAIHLDLVRVHRSVGNQHLRVLDPLLLPHADLLV